MAQAEIGRHAEIARQRINFRSTNLHSDKDATTWKDILSEYFVSSDANNEDSLDEESELTHLLFQFHITYFNDLITFSRIYCILIIIYCLTF